MPANQDASAVLDSILHLRRVPFFEKLSATSLAPLAYHAREVRFSAGEIVAHQSEISNQFCHVLEGTVRSTTGQTRGIREALGGLALFAGSGMPVEAVAESEVRALVIRGDAVFEALEDDSNLLHHLLHGLAARLINETNPAEDRPLLWAVPFSGSSTGQGGLDLVQRMLCIQRAQDLRRSATTALADTARSSTSFRAPKGEFIWRRGDTALDGILIFSGTVSALFPDRSPIRVGPAVAIGALDVLAGTPRRYDLISNEEVWGLKTPLSRLFEAVEDHFQMAVEVLSALARGLLNAICPSCQA